MTQSTDGYVDYQQASEKDTDYIMMWNLKECQIRLLQHM